MCLNLRLFIDVKDSIEHNELQNPEDGETGEVSGVDDSRIEEVAPVVRVHEVLGVGGAHHRKCNTQYRHDPKGKEFLSDMTRSALPPRPASSERIGRYGADDVADERRFDLNFDDLEPVDNGNDDDRDSGRDHRYSREPDELLALVTPGPRYEMTKSYEHLNQLTLE